MNKRTFNPSAIESGKWAVLDHVGRSSGTAYRTPLDAMPVDGGFAIAIVYGSASDWVQNVLAAETAGLTVDGERFEITEPRIVSAAEAEPLLAADAATPPAFLNIDEYLLVAASR